MDKRDYPWADVMSKDDFVSTTPSYEPGKYLDLFEDRVYKGTGDRIGALPYYVFDPTKHGYPESGTYPVIYAIHGSGGSRVGKMAINWAAAEMFASPENQEKLGGAYIVCPLAKDDEVGDWMTPVPGGSLDGYSERQRKAVEKRPKEWKEIVALLGVDSIYTQAQIAILKEARESFTSAGRNILMGTSAGGYAAWRLLIDSPEDYAATIIMAGAYLPSERELKKLRDAGSVIWLCHGIHDEIVPFDFCIGTNLITLCQMPNVTCYFPELVRNGDRGVASNLVGDTEMGQHCINNEFQQDLMYDDGTPYDDRFKDGVTGWIKAHK